MGQTGTSRKRGARTHRPATNFGALVLVGALLTACGGGGDGNDEATGGAGEKGRGKVPPTATQESANNGTAAKLDNAEGLAVDGAGNLYIADSGSHRVWRVDPAGVITTVAGTGTAGFAGDGGPATSAQLDNPAGIAVDADDLYIVDSFNNRVRRVDKAGAITTVAGTGTAGFAGDGGPATSAQLDNPAGIAVDAGNLYIADSFNNRVRRVDKAGVITTVAGTGTDAAGHGGPGWGDGGPAVAARLYGYPRALAVDATGNLYIADADRVRRVDRAGVITTVVGGGTTAEEGFSGGGGPASAAQLYFTPEGLAFDTAGNLYLALFRDHRVHRVDRAGIITTVAGSGGYGFSGDGGPAAAALLTGPKSVATDATGNLYIADFGNHRVRRVDRLGVITTVVGGGARDGYRFESAAELARASGCSTFVPGGRDRNGVDTGSCRDGAEFDFLVGDDADDAARIAKDVKKSECSVPPHAKGGPGIPGLEPATLVRGENWVAYSGEDFDRKDIDQIAHGAGGRAVELCER